MLLSWSITRQFLLNAVLLMAFLMAMIVAVDFSLNFDEYVKQAKLSLASSASAGLSGEAAKVAAEGAVKGASAAMVGVRAVWAVVDLWWPRLFVLFGYLLGPVLVAAFGFTCAHMVKHREVVAILASGQSLWRIARPMLLCTLGLIVVQAINREYVIPELAPRLTRDVKQRDATLTRDFTLDGEGRLFYLREVVLPKDATTTAPGDTHVKGLYAWERDSDGLLTRRIMAPLATWRNGAWELQDGLATPRAPVENAGPATRVTPVPVARLVTDLDPTALRLRRDEGLASNLSTRQLSQLIARYKSQDATPTLQRRMQTYQRIAWGRIATMLSTFLAVLVCVPFFLRKEPANMLTQSLYAAPVALGAFAATLIGTTASVPGLPPHISVFVPVLAMIPLAIAAVTSVRS